MRIPKCVSFKLCVDSNCLPSIHICHNKLILIIIITNNNNNNNNKAAVLIGCSYEMSRAKSHIVREVER